MPTSVRGPRTATAPRSAIDSFFQITERGSTVGREIRGGLATFFTMAYIVVLNPLIIGTQAGLHAARSSAAARRPTWRWSRRPRRWSPGVMTMLMGVVGELPAGAGDRARAQRVRGVRRRQAARDDVGRRHGPGRHRGHHHPGARAHRLPAGGVPRRPAQLKTAISVGIGLFITFIGLVDAGFVRTPGAGRDPGRARHRRLPQRLAAAGLRRRPARHHRDDGPQGPRRDPLRHRRRHHPRHGRRGDRQHRQPADRHRQDGQPRAAGGSTSRSCPSKLVDIPDFGLLGHFTPAGLVQQDRLRRGAACSSSP